MTISLTEWSKGLLKYMVRLSQIRRTRVDEDRRVDKQWVEDLWEIIVYVFSRNILTANNYMWTNFSLVYGSWLDLDSINKETFGSIVTRWWTWWFYSLGMMHCDVIVGETQLPYLEWISISYITHKRKKSKIRWFLKTSLKALKHITP